MNESPEVTPEAGTSFRRLLLVLGSVRYTPIGLLLLGVSTVAVYKFDDSATPWLAAPLFLLAINLMAAVASNGVFRRQMPLLMFHLALIVLVLLAAAGRLSYLDGNAEVTQGASLEGLNNVKAGPLHWGARDRLSFVNDGFDIVYMTGPVMDRNVNRVHWLDSAGQMRKAEIENNQPLVLFGYRIYPTSNKGFAPVLGWQPRQGPPTLGAVHLPSFPANATSQATTWRPVGASADIWIMLTVPEDLIPTDKPSKFRLPEDKTIIVRHRDVRYEMQPGGRIDLPEGVLAYHELRTWMGYRVFYDWTIPWILAACAVAVISMAWHFWRKFASTPWNAE